MTCQSGRFPSDKPNIANGPKAQFKFPKELFDSQKTCLVTDLDGCLSNATEMIQIYFWDRYQKWIPPEVIREFNVAECTYPFVDDLYKNPDELGHSLWEGLWNVGRWYQEARPNFTYWQSLLAWQDHALNPPHFLTARRDCLHATTLGWLNRWGLHPEPHCCVLEGGSIEKLKHLQGWAQQYEQIIYIDDKVSTIIGAARAQIPGLKLILFAQPWNAADSPDWCRTPMMLEGKQCCEHPEWDMFLHNGFDLGFRRLTEDQIASAIIEGLE
jgi:hypothetical protein